MTPTRQADFLALIKELQADAEALRIVDFNERKQEFFCRACRYRDPLIDGNKLHADNCPWVHYVLTFKTLLDFMDQAAASAPPLSPDDDGIRFDEETQTYIARHTILTAGRTTDEAANALASAIRMTAEHWPVKASPASPPRAWHLMDAAPKDGTPILCVDQNGNREIYRWTNAIGNCVEGWRHSNHIATNLTHWMPLPEPPLPFPTPPAQEEEP